MKVLSDLSRGELYRLIGIGVAVLLEGVAILSVALGTEFFTLGTIYPNIISVSLFLLPSIIGLLARRLEAAVLLTTLPWWITSVIYLAEFGAVWNIDLLQLGVLAGRVAAMAILLGFLGIFGWLVRRLLTHRTVTSIKAG
jgi:hypothetical protein